MKAHLLSWSRRDFIASIGVATGALACGLARPESVAAAGKTPDVVVFSKIYQTLKLDYEGSAALTAEAGLQGVDPTVRPGGEVLPERVKDDLPRYIEALKRHGRTMPMITTAITSVGTPYAEDVLRTAKALGVKWYRLGVSRPDKDTPMPKLIEKTREDFARLAELNRTIGITGMLQNHSPSGKNAYLGGDLGEMAQVLAGFNPQEIGVAFDIGHALVVHGKEWRGKFAGVEKYLQIAYAKDWKASAGWVAMGQGDIYGTGFFGDLKRLGYTAPVSLHIEHNWSDKGANRTREALVKTLRSDSTALRGFFA